MEKNWGPRNPSRTNWLLTRLPVPTNRGKTCIKVSNHCEVYLKLIINLCFNYTSIKSQLYFKKKQKNHLWPWIRQWFLRRWHQKHKQQKKNNVGFIKIKTMCMIKKMKTHRKEGVSVNHLSEKGLLHRIYEEFLQLNKMTNNPIESRHKHH